MGISHAVESKRFAIQLESAISELGLAHGEKVTVVSPSLIPNSAGAFTTKQYGDLMLENYLAQLEDNSGLILFIADHRHHDTTWTRTCVSHADLILLLGSANDDPNVGELEEAMMKVGSEGRKKLILIHSTGRECPAGLSPRWLGPRPWVEEEIHHIFMPQGKDMLPSFDASAPMLAENADFHRLARRLLGRSIALVLGGGGARGIAHLGVIKAFEDRGIPVDIIGGTSIGAFIGGIYARDLSFETIFDKIKSACMQLRTWNFYTDVTYPWIAMTSGRTFNRLIHSIFGEMDLRDTWVETYCAVTNLSQNGTGQFFSTGRASDLIRASMSFAGFVPPLCHNGDLLIDGCYSSNLPVSYATSKLEADVIFAVDVAPTMKLAPIDYGNSFTAWKMMFRKFWGVGVNVPPNYDSVVEVLSQAVAFADLNVTKTMPKCYYVYVPVESYDGVSFGKFEGIFKLGYIAGTDWLDGLEKGGVLDGLAISRRRS